MGSRLSSALKVRSVQPIPIRLSWGYHGDMIYPLIISHRDNCHKNRLNLPMKHAMKMVIFRFSIAFSMWVCLKIMYPYTQWLMIIIPFLNGYFIGNISPTFSDIPVCCWNHPWPCAGRCANSPQSPCARPRAGAAAQQTDVQTAHRVCTCGVQGMLFTGKPWFLPSNFMGFLVTKSHHPFFLIGFNLLEDWNHMDSPWILLWIGGKQVRGDWDVQPNILVEHPNLLLSENDPRSDSRSFHVSKSRLGSASGVSSPQCIHVNPCPYYNNIQDIIHIICTSMYIYIYYDLDLDILWLYPIL